MGIILLQQLSIRILLYFHQIALLNYQCGIPVALGKTEGFVKIAYDKDNIVKGVEIVAPDANALISEAALAIEMGSALEDIADTIHPHPTFGEMVQEAAETALGRPIHIVYKGKTNETNDNKQKGVS